MKMLFYSILILLLSSCLSDSERDKIIFKDSISSVEMSLKKMNYLMDKIPFPTGTNKNYALDKEILFINGEKLGVIEYLKNDTISSLRNLTIDERKDFFNIALYLRENYIISAYWDNSSKVYLYSYKTTAYDNFKTSRVIFIWENHFDSINKILLVERKILDHKDDLVLIGYK